MKRIQSILLLCLLYFLFLWSCSNPVLDEKEQASSEKNPAGETGTPGTQDGTTDVPNFTEGKKFDDFALTGKFFEASSDWNKKVEEVFGSGYRTADWNDLKAYYKAKGDLLVLFTGLGITKYDENAFVTRNTNPSYNSQRYYFASRHEGHLPTKYTYLAHDNIGDYIVSLGSWYGPRKILAVKKTFNPNPPAPSDQGKKFGDFGITLERYKDSSDWNKTIYTVFGTDYRVADWNDLIAYHKAGGSLLALYDGLGLKDYGSSAYVTRNGDPSYSSTRYYFASRHEHKKPSWYLAHTHIDNYLFSLGSWYGSNKILAIKKKK